MLRLLLSTASAIWSCAADRRLAILIFHRVRPQRDPFFPGEPDRQQFAEAMEVVARCFNCVSLDEAVERLLKGRNLPSRAVAITFDDGYADNYTEALPILRHYGLTGTFFIASGFLDGGCMWNDQVIESLRDYTGDSIDLQPIGLGVRPCGSLAERMATMNIVKDSLKYLSLAAREEALGKLGEITGVPKRQDLMLTSEQVRAMHAAGMTIGGHTVNHPILACLEPREAQREIEENRERLTAITGVAPNLFAYPNGKPGKDYGVEHVAMVQAAGYRAAVTTTWGVSSRKSDLCQLPRFSPWDREPMRFALRLAHSYTRNRFQLA